MTELVLSENAPKAFLESQATLTIFLKDGYEFFRANADLLTKRLSDRSKRTEILIVNPDSPHIAAVAAMDIHKQGYPAEQARDGMRAIKVMQTIRENVRRATGRDIADTVPFGGQDNVPTWNGFIGDTGAIINLYPTRPNRDQMPSLRFGTEAAQKELLTEDEKKQIAPFAEDVKLLLGQSRDLWQYRVPRGLEVARPR